jgi:hypothetical protein
MGEDVDFAMRVSEKYRVTNINIPLYAYMHHSEAITKSLNYDLLGRQIDHEIKYFMMEQRLNDPQQLDCMMIGDEKVLQNKVQDITDRFYENEILHVRFRLGYLLSVHMYKNALLTSLAFLFRKFTKESLKEFLYVSKKIFLNYPRFLIRKKVSIESKIKMDREVGIL